MKTTNLLLLITSLIQYSSAQLIISDDADPLCVRYYTWPGRLRDRLPLLAQPTIYNVTLTMTTSDINNMVYFGHVWIGVNIRQATNDLVINSHGLNITSSVFQANSTSALVVASIIHCPGNETVIFHFNQTLAAASGSLSINFAGRLARTTEGMYRGFYRNASGTQFTFASTNLEPNYARRVFPCFDQPDMKARFRLKVYIPESLDAVSNTDVEDQIIAIQDESETMKMLQFATTPLMSTYLFAVAIGPLDFVQQTLSITRPNVLRIYSPAGFENKAEYALYIAGNATQRLVSYFNVEYPLDKLDIIALPDMINGAMENYGAIIHKWEYLLVDRFESTLQMKFDVAGVIIHELAHQWFGNLVTCRWWSDIWLNEGFAEYFQFKFLAPMMSPLYDVWLIYRSTMMEMAFEIDAQANMPLIGNQNAPASFFRFDAMFSYLKGSAIVGMMENWIGELRFRDCLVDFLRRYQYSNADAADLLQFIEQRTGLEAPAIMNAWLYESGYPFIEVREEYDEAAGTLYLNLEQNDYHLQNPDPNRVWSTPIEIAVISTPGRPISQHLMTQRTMRIEISNIEPNAVVKLNPEWHGFYRCLYTEEKMNQFGPLIQQKTMSPVDRVNILSDVAAGFTFGHLTRDFFRSYIRLFRNDDSYGVCIVLVKLYDTWKKIMTNNPSASINKINAFFRSMLRPMFNMFEWESEEQDTWMRVMTRPKVIEAMAFIANDSAVITRALQLFNDEMNNGIMMPDEHRPVVYQIAGRYADSQTVEWIMQTYARTQLISMRICCRNGLAGALLNMDHLNRIIEFLRSGAISDSEVASVIKMAGLSRQVREAVWEMIKSSYGQRTSREMGEQDLIETIKETIQWTTSDRFIREVQVFLQNNRIPVDSLNATFNKIQQNRRMMSQIWGIIDTFEEGSDNRLADESDEDGVDENNIDE